MVNTAWGKCWISYSYLYKSQFITAKFQQQFINFCYLSTRSKFSLETSNHINVNEEGKLKAVPNPDKDAPQAVIVASGKYSYISPEGTTIEVTYTADELGFHPVGAHLPTPPPAI